MDFKTGGQQVILRLVEAYGFSTRQMLCDHLGVSKSTLATRFMRDIFPAEWVVQCALETGVSLNWLVNGTGVMYENSLTDIVAIPKIKIVEDKICQSGYIHFDKVLLQETEQDLIFVEDSKKIYLANKTFSNINDGIWLLTIEDNTSIRTVTRIPGGKIRVGSKASDFDCLTSDVNFLARIILKLENI